jgi:hypothetical protein
MWARGEETRRKRIRAGMYVRDDAQGRMDERRIRHDDGGLGRAGRIDGSMRWGIGGWAWSEGRGAADVQRTKDGKIERGE